MTSQPSHSDAAGPGAFTSPFTGNVADLVAAASASSPDHPALIEPAAGLDLTWAALHAATEAEAVRLRTAGVRPGDRVVIRLGHGAGYCVALLGALRAGAIAVPVGTHSPERELAVIIGDSSPSVVVAEESDAVLSAVPATRLPAPDLSVVPELVDSGPSDRGGEDIAVLGYTSGTTGVPRGVRLSHRALLANRAQTALLRPVPVSPADRVLLQLPLFHIYGLGAGLLQVCWAGATGVLVERLDPEALLDVVASRRVTVLAGVPMTYRSLLGLPAARLRDGLVSVRLCVAGGAPLAPALPKEFADATGLQLFDGYGLTETGPVLTSTLVGGLVKPGSVGRPLPGGPEVPGVELRLVDSDGSSASDDEPDPDDESFDDGEPDTGLVAVRGPNLFSGYWPDGEGGPDADGWFRTSDVGFVDADGDLYLVDRASDLIIVNGFNVYPHEVEQVLDEHPSIAEVAVVGIPDLRTGEAIKAVIVAVPGAELTADVIGEYCVTRLARFKHPSVIEFSDRLPRSATGKIARMELRAENRA